MISFCGSELTQQRGRGGVRDSGSAPSSAATTEARRQFERRPVLLVLHIELRAALRQEPDDLVGPARSGAVE
jgi:hypothetical protein